MQKQTGKFIVIDGTDGSGKATQTELLVKRLAQAGYEVVMADFPQYGQKSAGLVEHYLNGKYGTALDVGPYRASIFYAADRYDASFQIRQWLKEGKIVISNRYVTANMAHQGGKIDNDIERKKYFQWLYELEYKIFNIPFPDLNIILHVDAAVAQKLVDKKSARNYIGGKKRDIHEADIQHLRDAEKTYLEIANSFPNFELIECNRNNQIMTRSQINNLTWQKITKLLNHQDDSPYNLEDIIQSVYPAEQKKIEVTQINKTCSNYLDIKQPDVNPKIINEKLITSSSSKAEINQIENLKISKITPEAKLPTRAHPDDAGLDIYANENCSLYENEIYTISTGIKLAIPDGYAGLVWDKGSTALCGWHTFAGVVDSNYRGELKIVVHNASGDIINISKGQKIAQLLIQKVETPEIIETDFLNETDRNESGFGSTGIF